MKESNYSKRSSMKRFLFKHIEVNQLDGITAYDKSTGVKIRLSELSSGEQHELVFTYELLFVVSDGAVILIDEPELSLHVAWQRQFISGHCKNTKFEKFPNYCGNSFPTNNQRSTGAAFES